MKIRKNIVLSMISAVMGGVAHSPDSVAGQAAGLQVEVFTTSDLPITSIEAMRDVNLTIHRLDGIANAVAILQGEGLPSVEEEASRVAGERFARHSDELSGQMMESATGLVRAVLQLKLDRYPAVVFDERAVVYGVTDLAVARREYETSLGERHAVR